MTLNDFKKLCQMRRSVRAFSDEAVDTEKVAELIEIASLSPSVENIQPWHFHVITDPSLKIKLMQTSCYGNFIPGAAVFIVVTSDKTAAASGEKLVWNPKELEYSCVSAIQNFLLAATVSGIGTCWVSLHHGEAHKLLDLPPNEMIIGGIMAGMPREEVKQEEKPRKSVKEIADFRS